MTNRQKGPKNHRKSLYSHRNTGKYVEQQAVNQDMPINITQYVSYFSIIIDIILSIYRLKQLNMISTDKLKG